MIRPAELSEGPALKAIADAAYAVYVPRIGGPPGPMLEDYDALVARGVAHVLESDGTIQGFVVLLDADGYLLLDNVAVAPAAQGKGVGKRLMAFAEAEAIRRGFAELRLYTNAKMTENLSLYPRLGFRETHRARQAGFDRVFFAKAVGLRR